MNNEFTERFKKFDNLKLLKILETPKDYNPEAIRAAKAELENRNISDEEIKNIKDHFQDKQQKIENSKANLAKAKQTLTAKGTEVIETIHPLQKKPYTADRKILIICILLSLSLIYFLFARIHIVYYILRNNILDFSTIAFILPLIILPLAIYFFYKRSKIGWTIVCLLYTSPSPRD